MSTHVSTQGYKASAFSRAEEEELMDKWTENSVLWDVHHPDYKNYMLKEVAKEKISDSMGKSVGDIKVKMKYLNDQYTRAIKKLSLYPETASLSGRDRYLLRRLHFLRESKVSPHMDSIVLEVKHIKENDEGGNQGSDEDRKTSDSLASDLMQSTNDNNNFNVATAIKFTAFDPAHPEDDAFTSLFKSSSNVATNATPPAAAAAAAAAVIIKNEVVDTAPTSKSTVSPPTPPPVQTLLLPQIIDVTSQALEMPRATTVAGFPFPQAPESDKSTGGTMTSILPQALLISHRTTTTSTSTNVSPSAPTVLGETVRRRKRKALQQLETPSSRGVVGFGQTTFLRNNTTTNSVTGATSATAGQVQETKCEAYYFGQFVMEALKSMSPDTRSWCQMEISRTMHQARSGSWKKSNDVSVTASTGGTTSHHS